MFEKGPGVYHCLVRKAAKKRKDNGVIMTGNVWIEFGTYLNTRRQFATRWYTQTQRNVCGSSVHLNIEKCFAANDFSFSADKLWPNCQLLKPWCPPQSKQMGCVCSRISQETSYFGITAVGCNGLQPPCWPPAHCRPQPGIKLLLHFVAPNPSLCLTYS